MLHRSEDDEVHAKAAAETSELSHADVVRRSFFPITFPLPTGPGTIAASITLGAQMPATPVLYLAGAAVAAAGAALVSRSLYWLFKNAANVIDLLGGSGSQCRDGGRRRRAPGSS
jgi:multiple antibiotic resistance protein